MKTLQLIMLIMIGSCISSSAAYAQNKKALKYFAKAEAAVKDRKLIQASVDFTKAISHYSEYAEAYYQRGRTFIEIGQQAAGIKDLKEAIRLDSMEMMPYVILVKQLKYNKATEEAFSYLDAMAASNPDNIGVMHFEKAQYYESTKDLKKALHHYEMVIQTLDPSKGPNYNDVFEYCKKKVEELK
ncbi:MAG: hypothetical protein Sapg2KO_49270 [Saprospiraceae bacterium]